MRGILIPESASNSTCGITPACAGNTSNDIHFIFINRDHPRVCGEYISNLLSDSGSLGSPPRVRGIHEKKRKLMDEVRITPACAGNTACCQRSLAQWGDHPRVCGEYTINLLSVKKLIGSPPRVRGIPAESDF